MATNNHSSGNNHPNPPHSSTWGFCRKRARSELDAEVAQEYSLEPRSKTFDHAYTIFDKGSAANGFANASSLNLNPAMLLNPRHYANALNNDLSRQSTPTNAVNDASSSGSLEFQFAGPNDGFSSNTSTPPYFFDQNGYSHNSTPANGGFGGMIERANNVEKRTMEPQTKRRKVVEDLISDGHKFGAGGSGGILGQHVTDKRKESSKDSATVNLVELADDDSDVVEVMDYNQQEVCFGMIEGAKVHCHLVPSPKPESRALMPEMWPIVKIVLNRKLGDHNNIIHAKDHTRQVVGSVDLQTASALTPLLDSRLQLRTDCRIPSRRKDQGEIAGKETSRAYNLDIILYGPRKSARPVAKHLASRGLRLRHPPRVEPGIKYENPQVSEAPRQQPAIKAQFTPAISQYNQAPPVSRTVEEIRNEVMGVFDSLTLTEDLPQMEPDSRIQTGLLKHQKQGLRFMTIKEQPRQLTDDGKTPNSFWQIRIGHSGQRSYYNVITGQGQSNPPPETLGGILADMMGLGKTLSILSLVTTSLSAAEQFSISPPVQPPPAPPPKKNPGFEVPVPDTLGLIPVKCNARATLLVCPLSTVANWEEQIKTHIKPGTCTYYVYHGPNRIKDPKRLAQYDMVITTYHTVSMDLKARKKSRTAPLPLEEVCWFRVVLDEAHMIREQRTLMFTSIVRLQANRRWAVTGTPVQNRLDDLAALLAFIRLKPFDDKNKFTQYVVAPFKVCDPEVVPKLRVLVDSVTLRRLKDKIDLPRRTDHIVRLRFSELEEKLYKLFEQNAQEQVQVLSQGRDRMVGGKTYIHILQSILRLRLISAHGRDLLNDEDLELAQGMTEDSAIDLDSDEDEADKLAKMESKAYRNFQLMQETNNNKCHLCGTMIDLSGGNDIDAEREGNILGYMTSCAHLFCTSCKTEWQNVIGGAISGDCPICRTYGPLSLTQLRKDKAEVEHDTRAPTGNKSKKIKTSGYAGPHTKTKALLCDLRNSKKQSEAKPHEAPYKSVVFSAWTSHLDLIQLALDNEGIGYTRLDGKMSLKERSLAMDRFREDNRVHVILVSIMAGGLGLNLTAANNVYVMEPQYNPAAEAQAVDRVHRLGQKREVRTVRYIMEESIEEKMLVLQDKKTKLASLSMDRNKVMDRAEAAKQKLEDLRSLFK